MQKKWLRRFLNQLIKNLQENNFFLVVLPSFLIVLMPISLVIGPAIADLSVSIISILFFFLVSKERRVLKYFELIFSKIFFIFFFVILLSSILGKDPFFSLKNSFFYFRFFLFSLYFCFILEINRDIIKKIFFSFVIIFTILVLDSLFQYFNNFNILGFPIPPGNRVSSLFGDELILGSYLSRLLPIFICLFLLVEKNLKKNFKILTLFIILGTVVSIFLSGERSAIFLSILSLVYILLLIKDFKFVKIIFIFAFVSSVIAVFYLKPNFKYRVYDQTVKQLGLIKENNKDKQINFINFYLFSLPHESLIVSGFKIFKDHPILGVGPKNFRNICKDSRYYYIGHSCNIHPHNTYIQLLSETGIFSFFTIFYLFSYILYMSIKHFFFIHFKRKSLLSNYQICIFASFLINLWPFIPTGNFFNNWLSIIYFFPIGIYLYLTNLKKN